MKQTPAITRKTWLISLICVLAIGSTFALMSFFVDKRFPVADIPERLSFKKTIVLKTLEEYDRWHQNGVTIREKDPVIAPTLKSYWALCGMNVRDYQLQNGSWQYNHPWSAVFISWVMKEAGAGEIFPYSILHARYIVWARDNANNQQPSFAAYDINDATSAWPEPGDLVCMNRKRNRYKLNNITPGCISHCDIIVEVNRELGYIISIGGNVGQTVNKRLIWLTPEGYVDTTRDYIVLDNEEKDPEGSQKEIFGIIKVNPEL